MHSCIFIFVLIFDERHTHVRVNQDPFTGRGKNWSHIPLVLAHTVIYVYANI